MFVRFTLRSAFLLFFLMFGQGLFAASPDTKLAECLKKDRVARSLQGLLKTGFKDAQKDILSSPKDACAKVEKADQVFSPMMEEYASRTGDLSFYRQMEKWYQQYCGGRPASPQEND